MKKVDLHIHSYYSDGTMSPMEIVKDALKKNVEIIAITDHNELQGAIELQELASNYDLMCIPGVELDTVYKGLNVHILAYNFDINNVRFHNFVNTNRTILEAVSYRLIEKMSNDYPSLSVTEFKKYKHTKEHGGWKALQYFVHKGITRDLFEGFALYNQYGITNSTANFPSVSEIINEIHKANGVAVLAHAGKVFDISDLKQFRNDVSEILDLGFDGIECYYPYHTDEVTDILLDLAQIRNLQITNGCDCHGTFQRTSIGQMDIGLNQLNLDKIITNEN